jgi:(p)ppGpp synthase/HD superfamily hydrolase
MPRYDENAAIVALLHDVVEDTPITLQMLHVMGFDNGIVKAVDAMTRRKGEAYRDYIVRLAGNPMARAIKLADLEDNMSPERASRLPEAERSSLAKRYESAKRYLTIREWRVE